jgi:CBS domain-containing protein
MSHKVGEVVSGVQTAISSGLHTVQEAVSSVISGGKGEEALSPEEMGKFGYEGVEHKWRPFIESTLAGEVIEKRLFDLVIAQYSDSVNDVLKLLADFNITSVPVMQQNSVIGVIDVLDIMTYALSVLGEDKFLPVEGLEKKFNQQFDRPIIEILGVSGRNKWQVISAGISLQELIKKLGQPDIHRITIADKQNLNHYLGVVTQSQLLRYIYRNKDKIPKRMRAKIREIFPESAQVYSLPSNALVMEAFSLMYQAKVSGIAVTDDRGIILGNISASDIKHIGLKSFERRIPSLVKNLQVPLDKFLHLYPKEGEIGVAPIVVTPDDTLETVINLFCTKFNTSKFSNTHIHRIYVVDANNKPVRAISMGDIIAQFIC